jgi:hypothetical protein
VPFLGWPFVLHPSDDPSLEHSRDHTLDAIHGGIGAWSGLRRHSMAVSGTRSGPTSVTKTKPTASSALEYYGNSLSPTDTSGTQSPALVQANQVVSEVGEYTDSTRQLETQDVRRRRATSV